MGKKDLKLINSPKALEKSNNFWRVCPRLLEYLPESACKKGKPEINNKSERVQEEPECPWWINSRRHNYCFWTYVNEKSSPEGAMPELVQSELAELFGWSNTKTHFALKESMKELTQALNDYNASELLPELEEEDLEEIFSSTSGTSFSEDSDE